MRNIVVALVTLLSGMVCAQEVHVPFNGLVTDVFGTPLKRVKVYVRDIHRYAVSDKEGRFGLTDVLPSDTLHLLFNKRQYVVPVDGKKGLRIQMNDQVVISSQEDEDVVGLGYGFVKQRERTVPVSGIGGEELQHTGKTDILEALVGKVAGLVYMNGEVYIRGNNSLLLDSAPLFVVDGVETFSLSHLTVYDVDHVEVLKDASIYGSRGANGAIVVYTKK